jgi:NodT family efflux transporter outer membrane factor (OMF) lipoprotein
VTVAAETARAYAQICTLGEQLATARRSLDVVSRESEISQRRYAAGGASQLDVVRTRTLVSQVRATIPPLEGQRRSALFELAALLGRTPANAPQEALSCVEAPRLASLIAIGDGRSLLERRPDIRQAERSLAAATANIGVATADLFPRISITGSFGNVGGHTEDFFHERALTWGIGPSISWAFPNQMVPRARIAQAKAQAQASLDHFDAVVLGALKETEQALSLYRAELDRRQALIDAQAEAHQAYNLAHDQVLAGAASPLDLLTAEQTLVSADAAVAQSDAALVQDQITVFKALGGGWQTP